jgi:hypothetical protein
MQIARREVNEGAGYPDALGREAGSIDVSPNAGNFLRAQNAVMLQEIEWLKRVNVSPCSEPALACGRAEKFSDAASCFCRQSRPA